MSTENPSTPANLPEGQIEVDSGGWDDSSSDYGDEIASFTTSLASSVTDYPWEHGRRYHAYGGDTYVLPNDQPENERLDMMHLILTTRLNGAHHLAPIGSKPQRILDIGCGTGIWAIEAGDIYPSAVVIGNDLSPIQPTLVPPNVRFEVDDVEKPWAERDGFDYIHCRYMAGAIADWPNLMSQAYKHTKPGGWAEFQDFDMQYYTDDNSLTPEHDSSKWINGIIDACRKIGREPSPGPLLEGWMRDAGFKNIQTKKVALPIGIWPKDRELKKIGALYHMQTSEGLEGFTLRLFTKVLGWQIEEVQVLLAAVRKDMKNPKIHVYMNFHVTYGQKPEEE